MPSPEPAHRADVAPAFPRYRSAAAGQPHEGAQSAWKRPSMSSCHPPAIRSADSEKDSKIRGTAGAQPGIGHTDEVALSLERDWQQVCMRERLHWLYAHDATSAEFPADPSSDARHRRHCKRLWQAANLAV